MVNDEGKLRPYIEFGSGVDAEPIEEA